MGEGALLGGADMRYILHAGAAESAGALLGGADIGRARKRAGKLALLVQKYSLY